MNTSHYKLLFSLLIILHITSCKLFDQNKKKKDNSNFPDKKDHVVMVVDSSFDVNLEVFKDKIIGKYTIDCGDFDTKSVKGGSFGAVKIDDLDDFKDNLKAQLNASEFDKDCSIIEGFKTVPKQKPQVLELRDVWNKAVKARDFSTLTPEQVQTVNSNIKISHGTATASVIAYKNPDVKLVLVQKHLGGEDDDDRGILKILDMKNEDSKKYFDNWNKSIVEKELWELATTKKNSEAQALHDLAIKHNVDIVNKSYGALGPFEYVRKLVGKDFEFPELAEYLILTDKIEHAQVENMGLKDKSLPYLTLQSSGNESTKIESYDDTPECGMRDDNRMSVGAFDSFGRVSEFSNYGACVDFYILGSKVITAAPGGLLYPLDGTSFASPLGVRYVSTAFHPRDPQVLKKMVKEHADKNRFIKADSAHMKRISFQYGAGKGLGLTSATESKNLFKRFSKMGINYRIRRAINSLPK